MFQRVAAIAAAAALCGCATVPDNSQITAAIAQVQQVTKTACAFVPTAATVANIFASGNPTVQTVSDIATAICASVTAKSLRRGSGPTVVGVPVKGKFVR